MLQKVLFVSCRNRIVALARKSVNFSFSPGLMAAQLQVYWSISETKSFLYRCPQLPPVMR